MIGPMLLPAGLNPGTAVIAPDPWWCPMPALAAPVSSPRGPAVGNSDDCPGSRSHPRQPTGRVGLGPGDEPVRTGRVGRPARDRPPA
jgi:hypothetical protein